MNSLRSRNAKLETAAMDVGLSFKDANALVKQILDAAATIEVNFICAVNTAHSDVALLDSN